MINLKLLVLVAAVAYFTYPTVNFYRKGGIDVTETVDPDGLLTRDFKFEFSPEALDDLPADAISNLPALTQKIMCSLKLFRGWHAYQAMDSFTESDFNQLCKNFTEIDKCYANAGSGSDPWSIVIDSMHGRPYECNKPIIKTALRLCKLTYEDAMEVRNCYHNGMMQFSGSADEYACRRRCCHDPSTFNPSKPMICGPEKDMLTSEYCPDPFLDYTLRDNACQTYCAVDALNHYALNHCSDDALSVFMTYGKETMIKYMSSEKCFETCSW